MKTYGIITGPVINVAVLLTFVSLVLSNGEPSDSNDANKVFEGDTNTSTNIHGTISNSQNPVLKATTLRPNIMDDATTKRFRPAITPLLYLDSSTSEENIPQMTTSQIPTKHMTESAIASENVTNEATDDLGATGVPLNDRLSTAFVDYTTHNHLFDTLEERLPSDEEKLLTYLLTGYKPSARPVMNSSHTVPVKIQFSLMHIKELDVKSQILTTTGLLILDWVDERLTWVPSEHNNLHEIIVEIKGLWKPEFAVINGAENIYEEYDQFRAVITNSGSVHWEPGGVFKTMCEIDITYYPFDDQKCKLTFGAWSYHTAKMNLTNRVQDVNLDSYNENGEWDIMDTEVIRNEFSYKEAPGEKFANIDFSIFLRRRHTFYVLNVILPSIMTSVLLLSVFFCTPAQKVQIGVVVLLSFRIFLLNVADNIPKTSDHIPLLGIYLTCTMAITTLSMVLTVFVLNLHHISERPIPGWARNVLFVGLARIMGMCSTADALAGKVRTPFGQKQSLMNPFRKSSGVSDKVSLEEQSAMFEMQFRNGDETDARNVEVAHTAKDAHLRKNKNKKRDDSYCIPQTPHDKPEDYSKDWKKIAEIFDRLFFWLFLLAIVISTLILFHPLTKPVRISMPSEEEVIT